MRTGRPFSYPIYFRDGFHRMPSSASKSITFIIAENAAINKTVYEISSEKFKVIVQILSIHIPCCEFRLLRLPFLSATG